uniref:Uncharacterized protein n=1 Tax=Anguilla anguilla TaxID=7936 RepID=A0A0E9TZB1_ANGAN
MKKNTTSPIGTDWGKRVKLCSSRYTIFVVLRDSNLAATSSREFMC